MTDFGVAVNTSYVHSTPSVQHLITGGVSCVRSLIMPDQQARCITLAKRYRDEMGAYTSFVFTSQCARDHHWLYDQTGYLAELNYLCNKIRQAGLRDHVIIEGENELDNPAWGHTAEQIIEFNAVAAQVVHSHDLKYAMTPLLQGPKEWLFQRMVEELLQDLDYANIHIYGRSIKGYPWPGWNYGTIEDAVEDIASIAFRPYALQTLISETGVYTQLSKDFSEFKQRGFWQGLQALQHPAIKAICGFTMYDAAVPYEELAEGKDFGIIDRNGGAKRAYFAVFGDLSTTLTENIPMTEYSFQLGFAEWHDLEPDLIGEALEDEHPYQLGETGWQIQKTTTGVLQWVEGHGRSFISYDGHLYIMPDGADHSTEV